MKDKIIKLAQDEIGYLEKSKADYSLYGTQVLYEKKKYAGADNLTKYAYELHNAGLGHPNGYAWCMTWVCWTIWKIAGEDIANRLLCGMLTSASTMDTKNVMVRSGRQVPLNTAQAGDLVFRSRNGGGHVGLVVGRSGDGRIITIEGNTSASDASSWNGGAVAKHTGATWEWCCRPDYPEDRGYHWVHDKGKWYWQDGQGRNWHGWKDIKETNGDKVHRYWFDWDGAAATGEKFIDGRWYFFWPDKDLNECMECLTDEDGGMVVRNI